MLIFSDSCCILQAYFHQALLPVLAESRKKDVQDLFIWDERIVEYLNTRLGDKGQRYDEWRLQAESLVDLLGDVGDADGDVVVD